MRRRCVRFFSQLRTTDSIFDAHAAKSTILVVGEELSTMIRIHTLGRPNEGDRKLASESNTPGAVRNLLSTPVCQRGDAAGRLLAGRLPQYLRARTKDQDFHEEDLTHSPSVRDPHADLLLASVTVNIS